MSETPKNDQMKNEGEGNRTADQHYREGVRRHVQSGSSKPAAEEAERALESDEGEKLRQAEADAKARRKAS